MVRRNIAIGVVILLLLLGTAYILSTRTTNSPSSPTPSTTPTPTPTQESSPQSSLLPTNPTIITVPLVEQNNSGENGTATLTEEGGKITVSVSLVGAPARNTQPAHIHSGACPNPGAVLYPLTNITNGNSTSTLNTTMVQLQQQLPLAVNVHTSAAETGIYVACGNINF